MAGLIGRNFVVEMFFVLLMLGVLFWERGGGAKKELLKVVLRQITNNALRFKMVFFMVLYNPPLQRRRFY